MASETVAAAQPAQPARALGAPKLGVFTLAMMNFTAVVSLRGLPAEAEYGLGSIFYYLFAAVFFLIPVSLVAAELATGWPQKGGVFRWVGEAFGPRWGFVAIFLQWVESTIWFPTVLTFAAVSLAFIGPNQRWDQALSANNTYVVIISLATYWAATLLNFRGITVAGAISKWGGMIGTLIPGALIITLGVSYMITGGTSHMPLRADDLLPDLTNLNNLVLAASIFLFYAGMEMSAVHVTEVDNPGVNYPKAILIASLLTLAVFVLGTLAIGFIIPQSQINLTQSLLVAYDDFFGFFHLRFLSPVIAVMLAIGVFAGVATWVVGPSKGLLAVGRAGYLPIWLQHTNRHGVQTGECQHSCRSAYATTSPIDVALEGANLRLLVSVPRCSLRRRSGARHPRHARAPRRSARGSGWLRSSHLLRSAPRLGRCQVGTRKQARQSNQKAGFLSWPLG